MQEETWVLTEITMKIHKSSPSKKTFFFFFTGDHTMKRNLHCSQDPVTAMSKHIKVK